VTATPYRGWSEVPPVTVADGVLTGFLRAGRTVSVLVSCVGGAPEFAVSG
jgi:pyridoxal/pyridoxine/pyridoxamine kinase